MDQCFTEEDPVIKTRKPYTITKQRERWTDEEHSRFLEALKLYGRAWQRIEEHIGTKTAVQIRSHAQKFFTKLEKDALVKGVPIVQALDIDIPPPRPKRRPSNPYPRKTIVGSPISQVGVRDERPSQNKQIPDLDHEKANDEEQTKNDKENHSNKALEVGNLLQEACSFISSINKSFSPPVTSKKEVISQGSESHISSESRTMVPKYGDDKQLFQDDDIGKASEFQNSKASLEQLDKGERHFLPTNEMQSMGGSLGISAQTSLPEIHLQDPRFHTKEGVQGRNNLFANTAASAPYENQINPHRSVFQSFPDFRTPFTPICHNQDYYTSSTFSNLTSSTLWPYKNAETSAESSVCNQEAFSLMQLNSCHGVAAIAAATVAAATAWWADHGQLAPFHPAFTCPPGVGNPVPVPMAEGRVEPPQRCPSQDLQVNPEQSEVLQAESLASKLLLLTEPREIQDAKVNDLTESADHEKGHDDWNMEKLWKRIYHSSCCSNATSNDKVEIDAVEKNKKGEENQEELEANAPAVASGSKCTSNSIDSWKEVSQEGRLAFQALFSQGVLPQSFSPQQDRKDENQETNTNEKHIDSVNDDVHLSLTLKGGSRRNDQSSGTTTIGLGLGPGKITHRRTGFKPYKRCSVESTGFKPYKRCSVESTENRAGASNCYGEDKGAKRKRLEKASS